MNKYTPYAYLLRHAKTNTWYCGIQYNKNKYNMAHPDNLWTTYFTSSKYIHEMIEVYGKESFDVSVRKTFTNREEADKWEQKFLKRAWKIPGKINRQNSGTVTNKGMFRITDGKNETMIMDHSEMPEGFYVGRSITGKVRVNNGLEVIMVEEDKVPKGYVKGGLLNKKKWAIDKDGNRRWVNVEDMADMTATSGPNSGKFAITDGNRNTYIKSEESIPDGWTKGHTLNNDMVWTTNGIINRRYRREFIPDGFTIGTTLLVCPHCGTSGISNNMPRYHFDNCKHYQPGSSNIGTDGA